MTRLAAAHARVVVRLAGVVVIGWLLLAGWALQKPGGELERAGASLRDLAPVELPAIQAELRAAEAFPVPLHSRTIAVQHQPDGLTRGEQQRLVQRAAPADEADPRWPDLIGGIPIVNRPPIAGARGTTATTALTYLVFDPDTSATQRTRQGTRFAEAIPPADGDTALTGAVPARISTAGILLNSLPRLELVTAAVIALAVAIFYRSLVAPLVVLLTVGIAFVMSRLAITTMASQLGQGVPREVEPLLVALLLGVVTDYTLFLLTAMRRELAAGASRREAAIAATASTSPTVVVAALTVAGGCAALLVADTAFLAAFGPALSVTVLTAGFVVVTLVPALLALLGRWTFAPFGHGLTVEDPARATAPTSARSTRSTAWLARRRVALSVGLASLALLVVASVPVLDMRLGYDAISGLPPSDPIAEGQELATRGFAHGIVAPTIVLVEGEDLDRRLGSLVQLQSSIANAPGVAGTFGVGTVRDVAVVADLEADLRGDPESLRDPLGLAVTEDGSAARMLLVLDDDPYGGRAVADLEGLRAALPAVAADADLADARVSVAGDTAVVLQLVDELEQDMYRVALAVIVFDLLLLAMFLRSAIAPLLVVGGSVLAVTASLGITTLLFQGIGDNFGIAFYVPLATLVLLLSLGADYGIFSVGSAWQLARRRTLPDAVVESTRRTSGTIAVAGIVLAASFALLAIVPIHAFFQFAVAMSIGVLLDTFVVRPVLLPAMIRSIGDASMWPSRPGGALVEEEVEA